MAARALLEFIQSGRRAAPAHEPRWTAHGVRRSATALRARWTTLAQEFAEGALQRGSSSSTPFARSHCWRLGDAVVSSEYSKVWSVRNRDLEIARLDFLSGLRNRAFARLDFLSDVRNRVKIFLGACGGDHTSSIHSHYDSHRPSGSQQDRQHRSTQQRQTETFTPTPVGNNREVRDGE